jgi:Flp pilus assembly pilin Flp
MGKVLQLGRFIADRSGVTALEYGIIAAFFVVLLVAIFGSFGNVLVAMYGRATSGI